MRNPKFYAFATLASCGSEKTKFNVGAQLQTFHYPTISKPLLSANDCREIPTGKPLLFKSMTDRQTDKNTTFLLPRYCAKSEPIKRGFVTEDLEHVVAPPTAPMLSTDGQ